MIEKFRRAVILRIHSINGDLNKKRFVFLIKIEYAAFMIMIYVIH